MNLTLQKPCYCHIYRCVTLPSLHLLSVFVTEVHISPSSMCLSLVKRSSFLFLNCPHRKHYVSSNAMRPTWKPFASRTLAEQQLHFSLRLMTGGDPSKKTTKLSNLELIFCSLETLICARRFWLISPSDGFNCNHSRGFADFAATV